MPGTAGQGKGTKRRLCIWRLLSITGPAPLAAGLWARPGSPTWAVGGCGSSLTTPARQRLPARRGSAHWGSMAATAGCRSPPRMAGTKTMAEPEVREAPLPASPRSRKSGSRRWARAAQHLGERAAPWPPAKVAPPRVRHRDGSGNRASVTPQVAHCRSQTSQGLGIQTNPTSALSPLSGLGKIPNL